MAKYQLLALCLLPKLWVAAQSSSKTVVAQNTSTKDSLPTITPFVIPADVLSGLGLPLVIPAVQPNNAKGGGRPSPGSAGKIGKAAPRAPSVGGRRPPPGDIGPFGMQGGLPYELYKPRITANFTSITGAGHYTIYQCYNSHLSWRSASKDWFTSSAQRKVNATTTIIPTKVIVTTFHNLAVPTILRCDKVKIIPSESMTPISLTFDEPWTSTIHSFPTPTPTCGFKEHQCDQAWTAYSTKTYAFISSIYSAHFAERKSGLPGSIEFNKLEPPCDAPLQTCPPSEEIASCRLEAHRATVYYWPTPVSGNFCGSKVTAEVKPTLRGKANTAIYEQLTVTSPSPLVVIPSVTRSVMPPATMVADESDIVYRPCGYAKEIKVQLHPTSFSSIRTVMTPTRTVRHNYTFSTQYSSTTKAFLFDFADMNEAQVPWEAFIGAGNCPLREQNLCNNPSKTIMPSGYQPELSLGTAGIQTAEPSWAGCALPNLSGNVKFVPITAATVTAPSITYWGATVSVGPKTTRLVPSPVRYVRDEGAEVDEGDVGEVGEADDVGDASDVGA